MTIQTIETYASQILSYSQKMYLLAEQEDWDGLANMEEKRTLIVDFLFEHPSVSSSLSKISDTLRHIIDIDRKTMLLGQDAQLAIENEMKLFKQGKRARAADAYLRNIT